MNQDFTQSRWFYLELAKLNPNKQWIDICLANVHRILEKEKTTAGTVAVDDFELSWDLTD